VGSEGSSPAGDGTLRLAATICAAVLMLAGLWAARSVMTPVAFALFIIALVWPLQRRLQAVMPQVIAVLVTAALVLLAIGGGGWLVVWGFGGIAQWVIANAARLQDLYMHAADLLEQRGLYAAELFAEQVNVLWLIRVLRAIGGSLQDVLSFCIVTFVFVILGLLEVEPLGRRLRRVGDQQTGAAVIDVAAAIAARLQTYMLVRLRPQLHPLHRLLRCHPAAHPVCSRAVRIALSSAIRLHRPQPPTVRDWQLYRTPRGGDCGFRLPFYGAVCGILLGHALGHRRRIYRRADPHRARNSLRQPSCGPPYRDPAFGEWRQT
jgi:hypothetical protein